MRWKWDRIIGLYGATESLGAGANETGGDRAKDSKKEQK